MGSILNLGLGTIWAMTISRPLWTSISVRSESSGASLMSPMGREEYVNNAFDGSAILVVVSEFWDLQRINK